MSQTLVYFMRCHSYCPGDLGDQEIKIYGLYNVQHDFLDNLL